jgi:hypothetical protein
MWHTWEMKACKVFVEKPEGERPLGRPRHRWEDGIRMNLREIGWGGGGYSDDPAGSGVTELVSSEESYFVFNIVKPLSIVSEVKNKRLM